MHNHIAFDTRMISILTPPATPAADPNMADAIGLHLSSTTEESTYFIARILMKCVYWFLDLFGFEHHSNLFLLLYAILVFLVAWGIGMLVKWLMVYILNKIGPHVKK